MRMTKKELRKKENLIPQNKESITSGTSPFIRYKYKCNEKTGKDEFVSIELSDGTKIDNEEALIRLQKALKEATGTDDLHLSEQILCSAAFGMPEHKHESRLNNLLALMPAFKPQDETEATLFGQFLTLQKSGFKCLRKANDSDSFFHMESLFSLAGKLFRTANETMQTILRYRSGGRQEIQIVHLHNEGQAIVTQNLSSGGGGKEKI